MLWENIVGLASLLSYNWLALISFSYSVTWVPETLHTVLQTRGGPTECVWSYIIIHSGLLLRVTTFSKLTTGTQFLYFLYLHFFNPQNQIRGKFSPNIKDFILLNWGDTTCTHLLALCLLKITNNCGSEWSTIAHPIVVIFRVWRG